MDVKKLQGKTPVEIVGKVGDDELHFKFDDDSEYKFYHSQDCCESVAIEDIIGSFDDLLNMPLCEVEESTSDKDPPPDAESFTWTFYKFGTVKGRVTVRWLGESNGYYSESVELERIK